MSKIIRSWINPKAEIRNSVTEGKGMFAKENIAKGEKVVVLGGQYTNKETAEKARENGKLIMQWDTDLYSVEDRGDDNTFCWLEVPEKALFVATWHEDSTQFLVKGQGWISFQPASVSR